MGEERRIVGERGHRAVPHEEEALADLFHDFEMKPLVRMDAEEDEPALVAQAPEESNTTSPPSGA